jgi:hypothetical protein
LTSSAIKKVVQTEATRERPSWRLPNLTPRGVTIYRLCWALLFLLAVAVNLAAPHFEQQRRKTEHAPFSDLGLRQWYGRTMQVPHRPSLERAGVTAGSEIIAVGGRPVGDDAPISDVGRMLTAQPSPVAVTIRSPDGVTRDFRLQRDPRWIDLGYKGTGLTYQSRLVIDLVVAGLANFALIAVSALLFWRRPRDGLAALLSLSLLGFAAFENLSWFTWQQLGLTGYTAYVFNAIFTLLLIGLLLSPDGRFVSKWSRWVAMALIGTTIVGYILPPEAPPWLGVALWIAAALAVVPAMRTRFRQTPIGSETWQQQRWLLLGMSLAAATLVATFSLNALSSSGLLNRQQLVWAYISGGVTFSLVPLFLALGMLVALLRYRLYDADAALSRSAGFAIVGLAFAALFAGFAKAIELGIERLSGASAGAVPAVAAAVLATILVTPAQSRIMGWADERFRKALSHLRRDLPDCVDDLRETASLDELVAEILERVRIGLRVTSAAIEIDGRLAARPEGSASGEQSWPIRLPLRIQHRGDDQEGWLLVGHRPDGSLPARDEQEALEDIIDPISRSLRVVRAREARDRTLAETWEELGRRIARLEDQLSRAV